MWKRTWLDTRHVQEPSADCSVRKNKKLSDTQQGQTESHVVFQSGVDVFQTVGIPSDAQTQKKNDADGSNISLIFARS